MIPLIGNDKRNLKSISMCRYFGIVPKQSDKFATI